MRIHFTADDLRRVTIGGPERLNEVITSASAFVRRRMPERDRRRFASAVTPSTRPLLQLVGSPYGFPDFLTPGAGPDFTAGLDALQSTPAEQLRDELAPFARYPWTREANLVRSTLVAAVRAYERDVFRPSWQHAAASVATDEALRRQILAEGGVEMLLATLHPDINWDYPVLTLPCVFQSDYYLHGQGVHLMPTYFQFVPSVMDRPGRRFEVSYPAKVDVAAAQRGGSALQPLLGRTRATVLAAADGGATTSQIAQRLDISIASASEHATVLRNAGLIASRRRRNTMVHTLTPLGAGLVSAAEAMGGL